ncbi:sulfite exporter TauE/SafE family protein [Portibacter marinus]|uniref:sulfite exporter TauE/SafE family protein n=1 Tax=Portibacter marinus TaxID=2898660 RepID=UPI001F2EC8CC|nr:sulfite exporter TauE/SafE family protein [Portibacter marinus]
MFYVAFTLGMFGSLHCLGMCGPLAFALLPGIHRGGIKNTLRVILYNLGRTSSYMILGLIAGLFISAISLTGLQKPLTILVGIVLIIMAFVSINLERTISKNKIYQKAISYYHRKIRYILQEKASRNAWFLGMLNGLVPCGLVYLALAGALNSGSLSNSSLFMAYFGLGTFPAMFLLLIGSSYLTLSNRLRWNKVMTYLQLMVGIFLIYRGIAVEMPVNLELYWSLGKVMCH